jgi:hypothetical protein
MPDLTNGQLVVTLSALPGLETGSKKDGKPEKSDPPLPT